MKKYFNQCNFAVPGLETGKVRILKCVSVFTKNVNTRIADSQVKKANGTILKRMNGKFKIIVEGVKFV